MIDERLSGSYFRKTISEPQMGIEPAQWLQRLTGHQKVAAWIPVCGSEIVFLRIELDENSSIIRDIFKLPHFQHISH